MAISSGLQYVGGQSWESSYYLDHKLCLDYSQFTVLGCWAFPHRLFSLVVQSSGSKILFLPPDKWNNHSDACLCDWSHKAWHQVTFGHSMNTLNPPWSDTLNWSHWSFCHNTWFGPSSAKDKWIKTATVYQTQKLHGSFSSLTSKKATMMAPTMTKAQLRRAQRMREIERPPTSVNFSISMRGQRSRKDLQLPLMFQ